MFKFHHHNLFKKSSILSWRPGALATSREKVPQGSKRASVIANFYRYFDHRLANGLAKC
jgi:hypothetical protein